MEIFTHEEQKPVTKANDPSLRKKNRGRKFKIELSYSKPKAWLLNVTMRQKMYYNFFLLLRFLNF